MPLEGLRADKQFHQSVSIPTRIQALITFPCTHSKHAEKGLRKAILLLMTSKEVGEGKSKQGMEELHNENVKTVKKKIEDTRRWRVFPCIWIGRRKRVKMAPVAEEIYRFSETSSKFPCQVWEDSSVRKELPWKHKDLSSVPKTLTIQV